MSDSRYQSLATIILDLVDEIETLQQQVQELQTAQGPELPDECRMQLCTYYRHYLAQGPAELTHEGYHAAEAQCSEAQTAALAWQERNPDKLHEPNPYEAQCLRWERKVRA